MSLADGKIYQTDELGRISNLEEAREIIHELTKMNGTLLSKMVGGMPVGIVMYMEHPDFTSVYMAVNEAAHNATCETFDRKRLIETGELVPVNKESTVLPESIQAMLNDISKELGG